MTNLCIPLSAEAILKLDYEVFIKFKDYEEKFLTEIKNPKFKYSEEFLLQNVLGSITAFINTANEIMSRVVLQTIIGYLNTIIDLTKFKKPLDDFGDKYKAVIHKNFKKDIDKYLSYDFIKTIFESKELDFFDIICDTLKDNIIIEFVDLLEIIFNIIEKDLVDNTTADNLSKEEFKLLTKIECTSKKLKVVEEIVKMVQNVFDNYTYVIKKGSMVNIKLYTSYNADKIKEVRRLDALEKQEQLRKKNEEEIESIMASIPEVISPIVQEVPKKTKKIKKPKIVVERVINQEKVEVKKEVVVEKKIIVEVKQEVVEVKRFVINKSIPNRKQLKQDKKDIKEILYDLINTICTNEESKSQVEEIKLSVEEIKLQAEEVKLDVEDVKSQVKEVKLPLEEVKLQVEVKLPVEVKLDVLDETKSPDPKTEYDNEPVRNIVSNPILSYFPNYLQIPMDFTSLIVHQLRSKNSKLRVGTYNLFEINTILIRFPIISCRECESNYILCENVINKIYPYIKFSECAFAHYVDVRLINYYVYKNNYYIAQTLKLILDKLFDLANTLN